MSGSKERPEQMAPPQETTREAKNAFSETTGTGISINEGNHRTGDEARGSGQGRRQGQKGSGDEINFSGGE